MSESVENQAGRGHRKLAWLVGLVTAVVVFGAAGLMLLRTDKVKADLAEATQKASTAMASGQYAQAREILEKAIAAVPQDRPDRPQLIAEPQKLLNSINALAETTRPVPPGTVATLPASQPATAPALTPQEQQQVAQQSKEAHEQSAQIALADLRSLVAQKDFSQARDLARQAVKEYADTDSAKEFADLLVDAEQKLTAQQEEDARRQQVEQARSEAEQHERHGRFLEYRDAGIDAFNRRDYQAAVLQLQNAVNEEQDPETQALLEQALDKTTKPRIAVADFTVSGNVGMPDAGKSVAELLLTKFDPDRFQLVERSHLASILDEQNLTLAQLVDNPAVMQGKKLKGVKYVVLGTVVRLGTLAVSARLVNVVTGEIAQTAEIYANDFAGVQQGLGELAAILQMSSEEKRAYLEDRRLDMERQAQAAAQVAADAQAQAQARREAEIRYRQWQQAEAARQQQHEQAAVLAMAAIKSLLAQGNFFMASSYSHRAVEDFADTRYAREFTDLMAFSDGQLAAQQAALAEQAARERQQQEAQRREQHRRFVELRDQGMAAMNAKDYLAAIDSFRKALREQDDRDVARLLARAIQLRDKPVDDRPGLAVLDFATLGDVGGAEAGRSIADAMGGSFDSRKYRVIDRPALATILRGHNLTMAKVTEDPQSLRRNQVDEVRYVVLGRAVKQTEISIAARMVDVNTGRTVQTADLSAQDTRQLSSAAKDAAEVLQMTDAEKRDYLQDRQYDDWMAKGRSAEREKRWQDALTAYQKAKDIKSTPEARAGIERAQEKLGGSSGTPTRPGTGDTTTRPGTGGGTTTRPGSGGGETPTTRPGGGTDTTTRPRPGTGTPPRPTSPPVTPPATRPTTPPAIPPSEPAPKPGTVAPTPATPPEPTTKPTPTSRPTVRPTPPPATPAKPDTAPAIDTTSKPAEPPVRPARPARPAPSPRRDATSGANAPDATQPSEAAKPTVKPTPAVPARPVVRRDRPAATEGPATPPPPPSGAALVKLASEPASQPTTTTGPTSTDKKRR